MNGKITYEFSSILWKHSSSGGWHFVSLPKDISKEIRTHHQWLEEGWGRMKTTAKINGFAWETSIWFDTKLDTYLLPVKAEIRKKAKLAIGQDIKISITI
ncbi:DUF1905 domain-containing protein [Tenacibaculum agarivorans]|uniref:DUF1905 domain-containing protein n=1 Tax=Tenacibaculum agarivorans TaxID=1908389 RepID=UPI000ABDA5F2|nr:DUF1905 domain-containing protein [Tenacibaculum agarivorans]